MPRVASEGPNAEQIEYWNTVAGQKWVDMQSRLDQQLLPFGEAVMSKAGLSVGDVILDVGCGCGATSMALARAVGEHGRVVGADISAVMLECARKEASAAGLENLSFVDADAQSHAFAQRSFDVVHSRFGIMFFSEPAAAFANLLSALRPGGRLAFVCWQDTSKNPWLALPMRAALEHVTFDVPNDPYAPGPFAFADADRVGGILAEAGFADVVFEELHQQLSIAGQATLDEAAEFLLRLGPTARVLVEVDDATRARVHEAVRETLVPYATADEVRMPSGAWVVTARRPA
jgi:SAM-dependent methyltransferase